ncbi:hypothetical protein FQN51_004496 [Onygenales sp. PD_10]|nr:hypothetical protein FQN51_004496 [Onygenales sp. PD_10]
MPVKETSCRETDEDKSIKVMINEDENDPTYSPRRRPNTDQRQRKRPGESHVPRPKSPIRKWTAAGQQKSPCNARPYTRSAHRDHDSSNSTSQNISDDRQTSGNSHGPALSPPQTRPTSQAGSGFTVNDQYMTPEIWMQYYERARSSTLMADALEEEKRRNVYAMLAMQIKMVEKDARILELLDLVSPLVSSAVEAKEGFQKLWEEFLIPLSSVGVAPTAERQRQQEELVAKMEAIGEASSKITAFIEELEKRQEMEREK